MLAGMMPVTRRSLFGVAAATPLAFAKKTIPIGLELFSVRNELAKDLPGTLKAVAKMGYAGVEFFSPYYSWKPDYTKDVRKQLDDLGMKCFSTHNGPKSFTPEGLDYAIELNQILGSRFIVLASAGRVEGLDGWKKVADSLSAAVPKMKAARMAPGYHNHQLEFKELDGKRPMEVIAANTPKDVVLQLDVGTCVEVGYDPIAWVLKNPGRIKSMHCKEWSKEKGYRILPGDGAAPWKKLLQTVEKSGGVEYYLVEQEGYDLPAFETAQKSLDKFKALRGKG